MTSPEFAQQLQQWAHDILAWVGFGTIVGLLAKAIMPGRDPGGAVATLAMGIGGAVIGCGTLSYFWEGTRVTPISPIGLAVATAGAFVILAFYRLLGGFWFVEGSDGVRRPRVQRHRRRRARTYEPAMYDE
ncbi:MAG: GlsB/YeaQ/YmgE family stress response membrane protein [Pirellulaceae bacterium]|nr:GlsB/YeaQ/YmgE family stress response membrane protein [Planctomycetales bacterium]MCA9163601.1 GlsB/YeaQ/YmgE family stress response membrane protein [Planctomycetales bacterium]MCA9203521.1 GlsB/YeaQ/YmgE family stress response membrane protein [Planctomycetales bacterium]MCA9207831.1 GlsB/YeaQ/YmgE family stress response membrane protein [Planctomycetales bacterium]MCA9218805.1 GlsB/YeaQ/YmgE family stress response membrane protein [Planctomycetales bacterium]